MSTGGRRQEAAGRRQEAAGRRQEAAGRRQEAAGSHDAGRERQRNGSWQRYLRQGWVMLKGLGITFRYLFRPPITVRYPEEKRTAVQPRFKGRHWLTLYDDGMERCVGCELCVIVCPSQAIYVKASENTPERQVSKGERFAADFQINELRCIYCGFCEEACPTGAIVLGREYELAAFTREDLIYTKPMLTEPYPGASGRDPRREV